MMGVLGPMVRGCQRAGTGGWCVASAREIFEWPYAVGRGGVPPPPDPRDHRGKKRNLQLGKCGWAIFGTQTFGSQTLPPVRILPWPQPCGGCVSCPVGRTLSAVASSVSRKRPAPRAHPTGRPSALCPSGGGHLPWRTCAAGTLTRMTHCVTEIGDDFVVLQRPSYAEAPEKGCILEVCPAPLHHPPTALRSQGCP